MFVVLDPVLVNPYFNPFDCCLRLGKHGCRFQNVDTFFNMFKLLKPLINIFKTLESRFEFFDMLEQHFTIVLRLSRLSFLRENKERRNTHEDEQAQC